MARNTPPTLASYTEIPFNTTDTSGAVLNKTTTISWNAGDFVVVVGLDEADRPWSTAPTCSGLTFVNLKINNPNLGTTCGDGVWATTTAPVSPGSGVTLTMGVDIATVHWGAGIWVWRGSDGIGVSFEAHSATTAATANVSATPTDTHSAFCYGVADFNAAAPSTSVLQPTVTNTRGGGTAGGGVQDGTHYTTWIGDEDDQASSTATAFGITSGSGGTGPFSIVGAEILGTTSTGGAGTEIRQPILLPQQLGPKAVGPMFFARQPLPGIPSIAPATTQFIAPNPYVINQAPGRASYY